LTLIKNFRLARCWRALPFVIGRDLLWIGALTIRSPKIIIAMARSRNIFKRSLKKREMIKKHE